MLKQMLMASAVMIATPAVAQQVPPADSTAPDQAQTPMPEQAPEQTPPATTQDKVPAPQTDDTAPGEQTDPTATEDDSAPDETMDDQATPDDATPDDATPDDGTEAKEAPPGDSAAATGGSAAQPADANQIAQLIDSQFATYDKDSSGDLNTTEFASWMGALRSASEPGFKADAPDTQSWMTQAFASADTDKSKAVSKGELNAFLAPPKAG